MNLGVKPCITEDWSLQSTCIKSINSQQKSKMKCANGERKSIPVHKVIDSSNKLKSYLREVILILEEVASFQNI